MSKIEPMYFNDIAYALQHSEVDAYRKSANVNERMSEAFNDVCYDSYKNNCFDVYEARKNLFKTFGVARTMSAVAHTVNDVPNKWDRRYSDTSYKWAEQYINDRFESGKDDCHLPDLNLHPGLLNMLAEDFEKHPSPLELVGVIKYNNSINEEILYYDKQNLKSDFREAIDCLGANGAVAESFIDDMQLDYDLYKTVAGEYGDCYSFEEYSLSKEIPNFEEVIETIHIYENMQGLSKRVTREYADTLIHLQKDCANVSLPEAKENILAAYKEAKEYEKSCSILDYCKSVSNSEPDLGDEQEK